MKHLLPILAVSILACIYGCQKETSETVVTGISIDCAKKALLIGETFTITATITPADATDREIVWSSQNTGIATVDNGKVTAVGLGTTRIIAKVANGKSASCEVTVTKPINDIKFENDKVDAYIGESFKLKIIISPEDASDKSVTWKSSNPSVATISEGLVKPLSLGSTTITATSLDGNFTATCIVNVIGEKYSNPVFSQSLPDPTCYREGDTFYLFATEDIHNVPIMKSKDLIHWNLAGTVFRNDNRPNFVKGGGIWAPDINKVGDKYVLYYSMGNPSVDYYYGIGAAYATSLEGPWTLQGTGQIMTDHTLGSFGNCIDPDYLEYGGKKYLFYGSLHNINYLELTDDGLSLKEGASPISVAGSAYEGAYLHKHDNKWYLFASRGTWGQGTTNTYSVVVGRSDSPFGPFVNKRGENMLQNHDEVVIQTGGRFEATGHNGEIFTDSKGQDWILYHAHRKGVYSSRVLMLSRIEWVDGWPVAPDAPDEQNKVAPLF